MIYTLAVRNFGRGVLALGLCGVLSTPAWAGGQQPPAQPSPGAPATGAPAPSLSQPTPDATPRPATGVTTPEHLVHASRLYYNAEYAAAAAEALEWLARDPGDLAARELRTAALLFQVKRQLPEDPPDRQKSLKACTVCPELIDAFQQDFVAGRAEARRRLALDPDDLHALYFLGKLDLNYIWLQLGPLGRRTGWSEYREARKSIETVLKADPDHVRARVAHAWIEYIVDTRVMFGLKWVLGGGNKKRAVAQVREAAGSDAPFFDLVEARFALWEMLAREKKFDESVGVARTLIADFPLNRELVRFVDRHTGGR